EFQGEGVGGREEDTAGRGRTDMIETFFQGRLNRRWRDTKGTGKWDSVQYFKDNELVREERDSDGDGFFDLRLFYENGQVVRQEADTNNDRRGDVWGRVENNERVEKIEDQKFRGKSSAPHLFKGGQVVGQEKVADGEPQSVTFPFVAVEEEFRNMASYEPSKPADTRAVAAKAGTEVK